MYVGVTFTTAGPFRHDVPAVSSRSLDANNLFQIVETAVTTGTRMLVNALASLIWIGTVMQIVGF